MEIEEKLLNLFKESYYFELDRKDKINANLNFPITILVLVVGVLSYYLNNLPNLNHDFTSVIFYISVFALIVNICFCFYFLYRCFTGYGYDYVSPTTEIDRYVNDIHKYNSQVDEKGKMNVDHELTALLIEQYCRCATTNSQNNIRKTGYLRSTSVSLLCAVIIVAISTFPFFILKYQLSSEVQKVEITNLKDIAMPENNNKPEQKPQGQGTPNPAPTKPPSPSTPSKPVRPQPQSVQESAERKQPKIITEEKPKPKPKE